MGREIKYEQAPALDWAENLEGEIVTKVFPISTPNKTQLIIEFSSGHVLDLLIAGDKTFLTFLLPKPFPLREETTPSMGALADMMKKAESGMMADPIRAAKEEFLKEIWQEPPSSSMEETIQNTKALVKKKKKKQQQKDNE